MSRTALVATPFAVPVLQPIRTPPPRPSNASFSLVFLSSIDRIDINSTVERDGVLYYVLDVYLKCNLINKQSQERHGNHPDIQLEKRFSDFAALRHRVWLHVQEKHPEGKCAFCDPYMNFIIYSLAQPRLIVKIGTRSRSRKHLLAKFCNAFVRMAIEGPSRMIAPCRGQRPASTIVGDFFRRD